MERRVSTSQRTASQPVHLVRFYERDAQLADVVADFLAEGLAIGESAVWIGTPAHRQDVIEGLRHHGIDTDLARFEGRLVLLDAGSTLATFMVDGRPDPARFERHIASVVDASIRRSACGRVRAFGEMVDLLWRGGRQEAALQLEARWHELQARKPFTLLCAYALDGFDEPLDIRGVCEAHDHVDVPLDPSPLHERTVIYASDLGRRMEIERALRADVSPILRGRGGRALVVDADGGEHLVKLLRAHGFSTMVVGSAAEALRVAPDFAPDLALVDGGDCDELRGAAALCHAKLSAVTKQMDADTLRSLIASLLDRRDLD